MGDGAGFRRIFGSGLGRGVGPTTRSGGCFRAGVCAVGAFAVWEGGAFLLLLRGAQHDGATLLNSQPKQEQADPSPTWRVAAEPPPPPKKQQEAPPINPTGRVGSPLCRAPPRTHGVGPPRQQRPALRKALPLVRDPSPPHPPKKQESLSSPPPGGCSGGRGPPPCRAPRPAGCSARRRCPTCTRSRGWCRTQTARPRPRPSRWPGRWRGRRSPF